MKAQKRQSFSEIIQGETPVLVDFFAEWCGPCKAMSPILKEFSSRMASRVRVLKIDVDKSPLVASGYKVQGVPTLILFKKGQIVWRQSGVVSAEKLEQVVSKVEKNLTE